MNRPALVTYLFSNERYEFLKLADFGGVLNIVRFDFRVFFFDVGGIVAVFVDENGAAAVVHGVPEEGFGGEAENEKVARGLALAEDVGDLFDVGV